MRVQSVSPVIDDSGPTFSIVIPTFDRPGPLGTCLYALDALDFPRDRFEAIVVDDGGTAPDAVVAAFDTRFSVTLLKQAHRGPAAARNAGVERARGRYLAFTDDDCAPAPGWLRALEAGLSASPGHAVGGRTVNALPDNPYSTASQCLIDYLYAYYNADPRRARFFASNNLAVPADRFRQIGGFDTTSPRAAGEDREFCDRWLRHNFGLTYAPEAVVRHAHHLTMAGYCRQHFNYGRGAYYFRRERARHHRGSIELEPRTFYARLLRYPSKIASGPAALRLTSLLALSQGSNAAGFAWEWLSVGRGRDRVMRGVVGRA